MWCVTFPMVTSHFTIERKRKWFFFVSWSECFKYKIPPPITQRPLKWPFIYDGYFTYLRFGVSAVVGIDVREAQILRAQGRHAALPVEGSVLHGPCVRVTVTQSLQPHWYARAWSTVQGYRFGNALPLLGADNDTWCEIGWDWEETDEVE